VIKGSQFIINPEKTGYDTCAYLGLKMKNPSDIDHVLEGLQNLREVVECHYAMSDFDLFVKVYAKDHHHLLSLVQNEIQPLGLVCCKTILSFGSVINRQIPMSHLSDDEI
jgi:Lrp/AsnC family transcriptional regulator for asnA, asnC and gidA